MATVLFVRIGAEVVPGVAQAALNPVVKNTIARHLRKRPNLRIAVGILSGDAQETRYFPNGITPSRLFQIGSVSKVYTGVLLARLIQQKVVALSTTLGEIVDLGSHASDSVKSISLVQLATHGSGLPRLPKDLRTKSMDKRDPYAHYTEDDLLNYLRRHDVRAKRVGRYAYSNLGVGLLGFLLSRSTGLSYPGALRDYVLEPLGLHDTDASQSDEVLKQTTDGFTARGKPATCWRLPTLAGAGALHSTVSDQLAFLKANTTTQAPDEMADALRLAQQPHAEYGKTRVGLGWHWATHEGQQVLWHSGATGNFSSSICLAPDKRSGVVVLSNHAPSLLNVLFDRMLVDNIGWKVLSTMIRRK